MISRCPHPCFLTSAPISHTQRQETRTEQTRQTHNTAPGSAAEETPKAPARAFSRRLLFRATPFGLVTHFPTLFSHATKMFLLFWASPNTRALSPRSPSLGSARPRVSFALFGGDAPLRVGSLVAPRELLVNGILVGDAVRAGEPSVRPSLCPSLFCRPLACVLPPRFPFSRANLFPCDCQVIQAMSDSFYGGLFAPHARIRIIYAWPLIWTSATDHTECN